MGGPGSYLISRERTQGFFCRGGESFTLQRPFYDRMVCGARCCGQVFCDGALWWSSRHRGDEKRCRTNHL